MPSVLVARNGTGRDESGARSGATCETHSPLFGGARPHTAARRLCRERARGGGRSLVCAVEPLFVDVWMCVGVEGKEGTQRADCEHDFMKPRGKQARADSEGGRWRVTAVGMLACIIGLCMYRERGQHLVAPSEDGLSWID